MHDQRDETMKIFHEQAGDPEAVEKVPLAFMISVIQVEPSIPSPWSGLVNNLLRYHLFRSFFLAPRRLAISFFGLILPLFTPRGTENPTSRNPGVRGMNQKKNYYITCPYSRAAGHKVKVFYLSRP